LPEGRRPRLTWYFCLFVVSGFCALVDEVVWIRLAMAQFGVTTPFVALVLALFMAGLALGSAGAGRLARSWGHGGAARPMRLYGAAELGIGCSALIVPAGLALGRRLLAAAPDVTWDSTSYYLASGGWMALVLLPFCVCMGATFPLAMWAIRREAADATMSFSYLYLANTLGATAGTLASAFVLIELLGFRGTLLLAGLLNVVIAAAAFVRAHGQEGPAAAPIGVSAAGILIPGRGSAWALAGLFLTGVTSMGMEVIWMRQFTVYLSTVVYAFATVLALYLAATFVGSWAYRAAPQGRTALAPTAMLAWGVLAFMAVLPLAAGDPRLAIHAIARAAVGIVPFCLTVGFLTPMLVDRWSGGEPARAGSAYAVNVIGSLGGPLLASFWLLPRFGERGGLLLLDGVLAVAGALVVVRSRRRWALGVLAVSLALATTIAGTTRDYAAVFPARVVRHDHTATAIAAGEGFAKRLYINGQATTHLTPVTKMMVHLPLASLDHVPHRVLIIAFGMGTSFRSAVAWGVDATAVELVPSVPSLFGYFHADAARVLAAPNAHIVIDDGRRFIERTSARYDVVTLDPPPPLEAAGSSLLYSHDFYEAVRRRLVPGGILHQWFPGGELAIAAAVCRTLAETFPHVRMYGSLGNFGAHFLASTDPFPVRSPAELAARLPPEAVADMLEWGPAATAEAQFGLTLAREFRISEVLAAAPWAPSMTDDRPFNEYFLLRRWRLGAG
jgi:spermidine synthase